MRFVEPLVGLERGKIATEPLLRRLVEQLFDELLREFVVHVGGELDFFVGDDFLVDLEGVLAGLAEGDQAAHELEEDNADRPDVHVK